MGLHTNLGSSRYVKISNQLETARFFLPQDNNFSMIFQKIKLYYEIKKNLCEILKKIPFNQKWGFRKVLNFRREISQVDPCDACRKCFFVILFRDSDSDGLFEFNCFVIFFKIYSEFIVSWLLSNSLNFLLIKHSNMTGMWTKHSQTSISLKRELNYINIEHLLENESG